MREGGVGGYDGGRAGGPGGQVVHVRRDEHASAPGASRFPRLQDARSRNSVAAKPLIVVAKTPGLLRSVNIPH